MVWALVTKNELMESGILYRVDFHVLGPFNTAWVRAVEDQVRKMVEKDKRVKLYGIEAFDLAQEQVMGMVHQTGRWLCRVSFKKTPHNTPVFTIANLLLAALILAAAFVAGYEIFKAVEEIGKVGAPTLTPFLLAGIIITALIVRKGG